MRATKKKPKLPTPKQAEMQMKKEILYKMAIKLFCTYGYRETTISAICDAVGIASSSFYSFFESKASVILRLSDEIVINNFEYLELSEEHLKDWKSAVLMHFQRVAEQFDSYGQDIVQACIDAYKEAYFSSKDYAFSNSVQGVKICALIDKAKETGYCQLRTSSKEVADLIGFVVIGAMGSSVLLENWTYKRGVDQVLPIILDSLQ